MHGPLSISISPEGLISTLPVIPGVRVTPSLSHHRGTLELPGDPWAWPDLYGLS